MTTNITITKQAVPHEPLAREGLPMRPRRLTGWLWFIGLWCFGVGSAMTLGFAFKLFMNATLFAVG